MRLALTVVLVLFMSAVLKGQPAELWFYHSINLLPDENISKLETLWRRAAAAGYKKVLLADHKFGLIDTLGPNQARYLANVAKVRAIAEQLRLEIVPAVFPIGYSNSLLAVDPNLAEGLPVRNALFEVRGGKARLVPDPPVSLRGRPDWQDNSYIVQDGIATTRGHQENARLVWKLNVSPFRCYHVSVRVKTKDYTGEAEIKPIAGRKILSFTKLGVKRTQDWTEHHIVFGSLDNNSVSIYMGVWGDATGQLQWRDWKIEEVGLLNVLRRPGTPLTVEGFTEGVDYEPVQDAKLGMVPWPGDYSTWHEPPILRTRNLPDGTKLRVSWYFPVVIHGDQVCICPSDPRTRELLAGQAQRLRELLDPRGMMMSHDEVRVLNWDKSCHDRSLTPGRIMADNVRYCTNLLKQEQAYVWSDMFDPNHNATDNFYLVKGDLAGSWTGLDPRVTIVNWNFGKREQSLRFFADRGHKQVIAAYYDTDLGRTSQWLESVKSVSGIVGVMYTTWENNYTHLEPFAKLVREAESR